MSVNKGKNIAIGCGGALVCCAIAVMLLNSDQSSSVIAYGIVMSIFALVARGIFTDFFKDYGWYVWGGIAALALLLGIVKPLSTSSDKPNADIVEQTGETANDKPTEQTKIAEAKAEKGAMTAETETPRPTVEEALAELDALVGLTSVKEEVRKMASLMQVAQQRAEAGLKVANVSYHCVFTGNPGTGKTTVARIMAKIFNALGILEKGHLVEIDASGLLGSHVGETAEKTNKLVDSALGGVLFIDEAYMLADSGYGKEAIATLLKRMEDDRDHLVVILAGYTNEMREMLELTPASSPASTATSSFPTIPMRNSARFFGCRRRRTSTPSHRNWRSNWTRRWRSGHAIGTSSSAMRALCAISLRRRLSNRHYAWRR